MAQLWMPYQKATRKEKYDICRLSDETLGIINEMLNIMVERIQNGNRDMGILSGGRVM